MMKITKSIVFDTIIIALSIFIVFISKQNFDEKMENKLKLQNIATKNDIQSVINDKKYAEVEYTIKNKISGEIEHDTFLKEFDTKSLDKLSNTGSVNLEMKEGIINYVNENLIGGDFGYKTNDFQINIIKIDFGISKSANIKYIKESFALKDNNNLCWVLPTGEVIKDKDFDIVNGKVVKSTNPTDKYLKFYYMLEKLKETDMPQPCKK